MKKALSLVLAMVLILTIALTGCGSDDKAADGDMPTYEWSLSCEYSTENHQTVALQAAADEIEEKTDGHIKITVYPNMALGDYTVVYGQVSTGDIEIAACPISPEYDKRAGFLNMPYMATSFEDFEKDYFEGGFVNDVIKDIAGGSGIKVMGVLNAGFMGLGAKDFPADDFATLTDSSKKSTLMRVPSNQVYTYIMDAMGYSTTNIPYADLYSAMQNGLCEGWLGGSGLTNYDAFRDVIKYFVNCNVVNECIPIFMNQELFDSLPEEYQTIVSEAFITAQNTVNTERAEQEAKALEDMEAYGITVIEPTEEEQAELRDRIRQEVWPKMADEIGEELLQQTCEHYGVTLQ